MDQQHALYPATKHLGIRAGKTSLPEVRGMPVDALGAAEDARG